MEGVNLCMVCCYSFPPPTSPPGEAEESTVNQFARQVDENGESSAIFGEEKSLSVCSECLSMMTSALGKREAMDEVEVQVRHLQREILRLMRNLEKLAADYLEEMRGIRNKIEGGDEACLISQRKMKEGDGVWALRNGVGRLVKELSRFQQEKRPPTQDRGSEPEITVKVEPNEEIHEHVQNLEYDVDICMANYTPKAEAEIAVDNRMLRRSTRSCRLTASSKKKKTNKIAIPKAKSEVPISAMLTPVTRIFPVNHQPPWITWKKVQHKYSRRVKRYLCLSCPKLEYRNPYQLEQHLRQHESSSIEDSRPCPHCPMTFKHPQNWEYHVCCHEDIVRGTCDSCNKMHNFFILESHLREHHQVEKILQCPNCLYRCGTSDAYLLHLRRFHADGKGIQGCYLCPLQYSTRMELLQHLQDTHNAYQFPENAEVEKFCCPVCPRKFETAGGLKHHQEVIHEGRRWTCRKCGHEFKSKQKVRDHEESCGEPEKPPQWQCHLCEKAYMKESSLKDHLNWHAGEVLCCEECDATFASKRGLEKHVKRKHRPPDPSMEGGEKRKVERLPCEICGAALTNRARLKRHLRIHENDRKWACDVCGKGFRERYHLTQHLRIHSSEKPFVCQDCGKGFNQAGSLWHHRKLVHGSLSTSIKK